MSDTQNDQALDGFVEAVLGSWPKPPQPIATGTIQNIESSTPGTVVTVVGLADAPMPCRTLGTFDAQYATAGLALIGSVVVVITLAGQPYVLTTAGA